LETREQEEEKEEGQKCESVQFQVEMEERKRSKSVRSEPVRLAGHTRSVRGVSFSPKQHQLFCSGGYDCLVNFYDAEKQQLIHSTSVRGTHLSFFLLQQQESQVNFCWMYIDKWMVDYYG